MNKRMLTAGLLALSLLVTACGRAPGEVPHETTAGTEPKESERMSETVETTVVEARPIPTEPPVDRSTGKLAPQIVKTKYPTEDVVVADIHAVDMGYAVDPTGTYDSTRGIRKALSDCARQGGGTVYLPAGVYVVSGTVTVPPFVTLRGDWQNPDEGDEYGTVISLDIKSEDVDTKGTFMLGGSGGVVGLTVYYPAQSLSDIKPYPFVFYTDGVGTNYMLSTVKNVTVLNGYRGLGASCAPNVAHEQLTVENFMGTFLRCGAEVYNQADVGTWQGIRISPAYWQQALSSSVISSLSEGMQPSKGEIADYMRAHAVGLRLGDLEWTQFADLSVAGCKTGLEIVKGKRIQFAGSLYDISVTDCGLGIDVLDLDPRWGMVIADSTVEGGIRNTTEGTVKLCDVNTTGALIGQVATSAQYSDLSAFAPRVDVDCPKPAEVLYVAKLSQSIDQDASVALQSLLDDAEKTGGIVYVPAGQYRMEQPLTVPAGVELRGATSVATRDQSGMSKGTVFLCYYGDDADSSIDDRAFLTLAGERAGMRGIRILYPENSPLETDLHTTYAVRGEASGVYAVHCAIVAAAYGIDFRGCDGHIIERVMTCCYENTFAVGGHGGTVTGCLQNGTTVYRTGASALVNWPQNEANIWAELFDPITRQRNVYILVEGATDQHISHCFIYGCANMIVNRASTGTLAVNIGADNIGSSAAQLVQESGELTAINVMRYNGYSYDHRGGELRLYNRMTILDKTEETLVLK